MSSNKAYSPKAECSPQEECQHPYTFLFIKKETKALPRDLGWDDALEKGKATHTSILACRIPWTKEPGGLQSRDCKELDTTDAT